MPLEVAGSYFSWSGFREASYLAWLGTISMGDCLGPSAIGKFLTHLSGPGVKIHREKCIAVLSGEQCDNESRFPR